MIRKAMLFFLTGLLLAACTNGKIYDHYNHTPVTGWEKNDTLIYSIPSVAQQGVYSIDGGLRITNTYPFIGLTLIVETRVFPQGTSVTDTVSCQLYSEEGNVQGQGLSYYQYTFHVTDLQLKEADSVQINVRHDMKREILPGISDIGIQLTKKTKNPKSRL